MDREFSDALEQILTKRGIRIYKESILERVEKKGDLLGCRFVHDGKNKEESVDVVLVSVGRAPAQRVFLKRMFLSNWKMGKLWWMNFTVPACRESMR